MTGVQTCALPISRRRIVSFHEEEGCQLLEFRNREMFLSCVDQYTGMQYRYQ